MLNTLILTILVITQVLGDVCLSEAMKIHGEITSFAPNVIIDVIYYLFTSPFFYFGLGSLTISWFIYLFAVSKMDLSYVLPIHASSYICNALLAWLILGENVSFLRWFATGFISVGVFIVGYSQYREKKKLKQLSSHVTVTPKDKVSPVFAFISSGVFLPTVWLGVIVMVLADSMGDLLNAKGMRQIATLKKFAVEDIFRWVVGIFTNLYIIIGVSCQAIALLLFLSLLSWDDLSFVRPASAVGYLVTITSAKYILHEKISKGRWIGISCILLGVVTLSQT
ncbi:EamA family transporter [Cyanobacterium aponinum UTEX 3222]|uniref:EamA family transporter n=1 Tax=Cyanobacterium aponinum TaxID=379064 RepID=UPI002B4BC536|nr:EamA family transporter [Cyanobacterium aponinum]WRL38962.1 EamA family transporter [Cyanobacterium aponinum UTEX 3221]WRL40726.1 EamA family transporter [Cyanobacterium aponinum UTEX 3222]